MDLQTIRASIDAVVSENLPACIALSDDFVDHPELPEQEFETSRKIVEFLRSKGYDVKYPALGFDTAFFASYGEGGHSHKAAILVEYDALPEIGHACGHAASAMISVLAALSLKDLQDELDTDVHLFGTPAEETILTKCPMADAGYFDDYDFAIMVHLFNKNIVKPIALAMNAHTYTFHGRSAHAASAPWEGLNALNAVMLMFQGIDMLRQHVSPDVRMHGIITEGGNRPNIVPDRASAYFHIRAEERPTLNKILAQVDRIAEGAALMTGTTFEKGTPEPPVDNVKSNAAAEAALTEAFSLIGETPVSSGPFGSTDVGNVSYRCPAVQPTLKVADEGIDLHTVAFEQLMKGDCVHAGIGKGARLIAYTIAELFSDPAKAAQLRADFEKWGLI